MKKEVAEKIVRGIEDKIQCNTADIDDWAEFWGFTREEYEEFLDMAIQTLEQQRWIPVSERLPKELEPVNITWVNHNPESYYVEIKDKPFTATGVYFNGQWYWWSTLCTDILSEYSHNYDDIIDDDIEITAWKSLPEPYKAESEEEKVVNELEKSTHIQMLNAVKDWLEQPFCEDCISREAVIQIIENKLNPCTDMFKCLEMSEIKEDVEHLPSVTPQTDVLNTIRDEIKGKIEQEEFARSVFRHEEKDIVKAEQCTGSIMAYNNVIKFIDKYRKDGEANEVNRCR